MPNPDQGQAVLCPLGRVLHLAEGRALAFGNKLLPFHVGVTILLPGRWVVASEEWVLRNKFGGPSWEQTDSLPTLGLFTWGCPCPRCGRVGGPSPREALLCLCSGAGPWSGWERGPGVAPLWGEPRGFPRARPSVAGLCGVVGLGDGPLVSDRTAALSIQPAKLRPFPSLAAWQKFAGHTSVIPSEVWHKRPVSLVTLSLSHLPLGSLTPSSFVR